MEKFYWFLAGLAAGVMLSNVAALILRIFHPWLRCFLCGAPVTMFHLLGMYLRGNPVRLLTDAHIGLVQGGAMTGDPPRPFRIHEVEAKYLANPGRYLTADELMRALREDAVTTTTASSHR